MAPFDGPWHEGERAVQRHFGVADRMAAAGRAIRPFMPAQHRAFFAELPFVLAGSTDRQGRVWASLLSGAPGFVTSPTERRLEVAAWPPDGDPLGQALVPRAAIALLGIELPTRRRNRANGRIARAGGGGGFAVDVVESFGNCPKYIARRDSLAPAPGRAASVEALSGLTPEARRLIGEAATFFVASSAGPGALPDVSHRGGPPGFVALDAAGALTVPDYAGNRFYNTLGNLLLNPQAGLLFPDFAAGDLLQLTGATELVWAGPQVEAVPGAQSLWRFRPERGQWLRGALSLRFGPAEASPFWPAAAQPSASSPSASSTVPIQRRTAG